MSDEPTCGRGLAEHSLLPAKVGELAECVADNLEVHMTALDVEDEDARKEHDAYGRLVQGHRSVAARLRALGQEMAGYRDLPMGRHDEAAMSSPGVVDAFRRFVRVERELLDLLQKRVEQDRELLGQADGPG